MKVKFLLLFIIYTTIAYSNSIDTTIFSNESEKAIFKDYNDSLKIEPLDLLLSFDYSEQNEELIKNRLNDIYEALNLKGISSKSRKKQIKIIYKYVHDALLKKYVEKAFFNDQFINGTYNCVTATALFALVLDHFNIPFLIKEMPTHVYIVGDPGASDVLIETTLPSQGAVYFDEKYKKEFVMYLVNNKIVSQDEFNQHSIDYLFNEHFDQNKNIDLIQLAALLYYNNGIFKFQASNFKESARSFEKAYLLYPSNSIKFSYSIALGSVLDHQSLNKTYEGKSLAKFLNLNINSPEAINSGETYFNVVSNNMIIEHQHVEEYKKYYNDFRDYLTDSVDMERYSQTYYRMLGYNDFAKGNYSGSIRWLNFAYLSNPDNLEIRELIETVSIKLMFTDSQHESMIDTMDYYFEIFPFLMGKDNFQSYYTYCYVKSIQHYFLLNQITKGTKLLEQFEHIIEGRKDFTIRESIIEGIYMAISADYIRKGNYNVALQYTERGLHFAPNSYELKNQAQNIKRIKNINKSISQSDKYSYVPSKSEQFKEEFQHNFPQCWKATKVIEKDKARDITSLEKFEIDATDDQKVSFNFRNITYKGKWALRTKSKLLYLVPDRNKENYFMFKILEMDNNIIKLRYYEKGKFNSEILVLESCSN